VRRLSCIAAALLFSFACAPKSVIRPSGPQAPLTDGPALLERATSECRGVRTLSAELQIAGRVGRQKLRGRALIGAAEPASLRLEGVAPFGQPAFILVAREGRGTLLLPRDRRVLRDAQPERILEALTGVSLAPPALRALLAGCFSPPGAPAGGERYGDRWARLSFDRDADTLYLRRDGDAWHVVGATVGALTVEYDRFSGNRPEQMRIRTSAAGSAVSDLSLSLSQVEMNVPIDAAAFEVRIPADAEPLTLDELKSAGPLGQK
jgi:hypothetical protein